MSTESNRTVDRPLSDAMERALAGLAGWRDANGPHAWVPTYKAARSVTTISALETRGLAETQLHGRSLDWDARITDAGLALCNSMGD